MCVCCPCIVFAAVAVAPFLLIRDTCRLCGCLENATLTARDQQRKQEKEEEKNRRKNNNNGCCDCGSPSNGYFCFYYGGSGGGNSNSNSNSACDLDCCCDCYIYGDDYCAFIDCLADAVTGDLSCCCFSLDSANLDCVLGGCDVVCEGCKSCDVGDCDCGGCDCDCDCGGCDF